MRIPRVIWALLAVTTAVVVPAGSPVTYRWTDADGVHYSDQPHAGAEKIYLGQSQTYSSASAERTAVGSETSRRVRNADDGPFRYDSCAVVQPAQDQVLLDVESATVAVQPRPTKRGGDRVVLSFDGRAIEPASSEQQEFQITPIERGTHTVAATIRDADGKSVCQSAALSFHVRQPSVLAPQNPNNPNRKH